MTAFDGHTNGPYSLVATAPSPATSGLTLVITAGDGAIFPVPPFNAVVWPVGAAPLTTTFEIIRVTGLATDTFTFTRGPQAGDPGGINRTILVGDQIAANVTKKTLTDIEAAVNFRAPGMVFG